METKEKFDAVGIVRRIRDAHYHQTEGMTMAERLAYYREQGLKARRELERLSNRVQKRK